MVFDLDDFHQTNHRLELLHVLHDIRPDFKMTAFAVPGLGTDEFWNQMPDWIELGVHGHLHPDPMECVNWTADRMRQAIREKPARFANLWRSPGWQTSNGIYEALLEADWAIADQSYNDFRRPAGLRCHILGDGDHWHGHVQNVCGNGLEETWDQVVALVKAAPSFEFVSEVVQPWVPESVAA